MIPILYEAGETSFVSNGIARLRDAISVLVTEERNGVYELDFTYPIDGAHFDDIKPGRIVAVTHDDNGDIQPFDIVSYSKPIDGIASFHGVHISYRQSYLTATGEHIWTLSDAFNLLSNAEPSNPFYYTSALSGSTSGLLAAADGTPKSVRSLLGGTEGSILDTFGGEYEFDKFHVILHKERGITRDFLIRYGVNMTDYQDDTDFAETFNSCVPFWNGEGGPVVGARVDSGLQSFNGSTLCVPLDLTDKFEDMPTAAQLQTEALAYMIDRQPNLGQQNIKVNFLRLQDLSGYEDYENLLKCNLCDKINVAFPRYGMSGTFEIVRVVWDALEGRYQEMELGALQTTLAEALGIGSQSSSGLSGGGSALIRYGTCGTAQGTAAKVATVSPGIVSLESGTLIFVKFTNANTATNPTLNVNGLGAKSIKRYGTTAPSTSAEASWNAGSVVAFVYDGSYWQMVGWINTTYSSMTQTEYETGTGTTARLITPAILKAAILYWATPTNIGAMASDAIVTGSYVYNGSLTTTITITDSNVDGKTHVICGAQDAGNPPLRASISGTTITVYLSDAVTLMRVNYICY